MSLASKLEQAIIATNPAAKCELVKELADYAGVCAKHPKIAARSASIKQNECDYLPKLLLDAKAPSYASFCKITHPTRIRRAKELNSPSALARTLHSVAHIEYSAIDLALDSAYRFAPVFGAEFLQDFLRVAAEEVEHFSALAATLRELGCEYGEYAVHSRLHEAAAATQESARVRMGVVHRWLEACGLDANPFVARKILASPYAPQKLLAPVFERILRDEITHVNAGHRYYIAAGGQTGEKFATLLKEYAHLCGKINWLNTPAREQAGYAPGECELISRAFSAECSKSEDTPKSRGASSDDAARKSTPKSQHADKKYF